MDEPGPKKKEKRTDSVTFGAPYARLRVILFLIVLFFALVVLGIRSLY